MSSSQERMSAVHQQYSQRAVSLFSACKLVALSATLSAALSEALTAPMSAPLTAALSAALTAALSAAGSGYFTGRRRTRRWQPACVTL